MVKKKTLAGRITEHFLDGLIVLMPPAITIFVVMWTVDLTENLLGKYIPIDFPGIGLIAIIFTIWFVGFITGNRVAQKIIHFGELILDKIPVVKFIYTSVKQFSKAVFDSNSSFQKVVLVPYHQSLALGFLINNIPEPVQKKLGEEYVCVFVPWSLNMTSGTNLFVKKSEVIYIEMKSEDALQFMLTAGTVSKKGNEKATEKTFE